MKTWNHKDAVSRLTELLDRQGLGKVAEEVKTIKDPEEGQNGEGVKQQAELEAAPAMAPIDSNVSDNTTMTEGITNENHTNGTDGSANTQEVGMKVQTAQESASKEASEKENALGAAFARGLVNKTASCMAKAEAQAKTEEKQQEVEYLTGKEMFAKKAAMMDASEDMLEKAAADFYGSLPALHANPMFQKVFQKCAAQKMAEDVAAAMEATGAPAGSEAEIAAALEGAVAEDPELAAELEGEITSDAIDELAMAEEEAAVIDELAAEAGVPPEAIVEAARLIEEAAAENGMTPDEFAATVDAVMQEGAAAKAPAEPPATEAPKTEAPATEEPPMDAVKEASFRRIQKAASWARAQANLNK